MIKTPPGGSAFPWQGSDEASNGMTMRAYFAAHAPIGVAEANECFYRGSGRNATFAEMMETLAKLRGKYADAMLAELAK